MQITIFACQTVVPVRYCDRYHIPFRSTSFEREAKAAHPQNVRGTRLTPRIWREESTDSSAYRWAGRRERSTFRLAILRPNACVRGSSCADPVYHRQPASFGLSHGRRCRSGLCRCAVGDRLPRPQQRAERLSDRVPAGRRPVHAGSGRTLYCWCAPHSRRQA